MLKRIFNWLLDRFYLVLLVVLTTLGVSFSPDMTLAEKQGSIAILICLILLGFVLSIWIKWRQREAP